MICVLRMSESDAHTGPFRTANSPQKYLNYQRFSWSFNDICLSWGYFICIHATDRSRKTQPYPWLFQARNEVDWHRSATNSNIKRRRINSSWQRWDSSGDADVHPTTRSVGVADVSTGAKGTALPPAQLQRQNPRKDRSEESRAWTFSFLIKLIP